MTAAAKAVATRLSTRSRAKQRDHASDTWVRCAIALVVIRVGQALMKIGARVLSEGHPARTVYVTGVDSWIGRTSKMPWRGLVPTAGFATRTQVVWCAVAIIALFLGLTMFGVSHVALPGHPVATLVHDLGLRA